MTPAGSDKTPAGLNPKPATPTIFVKPSEFDSKLSTLDVGTSKGSTKLVVKPNTTPKLVVKQMTNTKPMGSSVGPSEHPRGIPWHWKLKNPSLL